MTVRMATVDGVAMLLSVLRESGEMILLKETVLDLEKLLQGSFHDRKVFAHICGAFLRLNDITEDDRAQFMAYIEQLARDRTPNVRLVVANALPSGESALREMLRKDLDWDVRLAANGGIAEGIQARERREK